MKIKELSLEQRPRERLLRYGSGALSDAELLAIILQQGVVGENVLSLSQRLLTTYPLRELHTKTLPELCKLKGIGTAKAVQLQALSELSKRMSVREVVGQKITCAEDVYTYAWPLLQNEEKEKVLVLVLDNRHVVVGEEIVSVGTVNSSLVHPREVFKLAVRLNGVGVIVVHNHPSGNVEASEEDISVASTLAKAGKVMGVSLVDFLVVSAEGYWSWKKG